MTFRAIPFNPLPSAGAFVAPSLRLMRFLARDRASQKIPGEMSARAGAAREAWPLLFSFFFFNEFWAHTPTHTTDWHSGLKYWQKKCSKVHRRVLDMKFT